MAQKQFLHELLKDDQEPFRLKNYIADRRSRLKKPSPATTLQLKNRKPKIVHETSTIRNNILCRHACSFSFQNSPDVRRSPFFEFSSPSMSPCKSPNGADFLHIPPETAALLLEAALRIQKQQQSRPKAQSTRNVGLGLFGSFLKRLKDRSKNKRRAIGDNDFKVSGENATILEEEEEEEETIRISCSCSNRRLSSANWTENTEGKSLDFEASTSSCGSECTEEEEINDFASSETRFCPSPFKFNLHRSQSSSGRRTPDFCSPTNSPSRRVNQEKENYKSRKSDNVQGEEEENKEQCSPVSVLDPPFENEGRESRDADDGDDYDQECSDENVQNAEQQLLYRLRRFEKLGEVDTMELERTLLEASDDEDQGEIEESDDDEHLSLYGKQSVETILTQVFNQSSLQYHSGNMSADMKKLVSDLIDEEKSEIVFVGNINTMVMSRISNRLDSWREVESNTIDMMIGFDFKKEFGQWTKFHDQVEEISAEIEVAIYGLLVEELSDELFNMDAQR